MEGKDAIIARIIGDAKKRADVLDAEADANVKASLADAGEWAENYKNTQRELLKAETENIVSRRKTVAELDCRKAMLSAKQEVIGAVLSRALAKALGFGKEKYLSVVEKLIEENAEKGDTIILAKGSPVEEKDIAALPVVKELALSLGGSGDFSGGVFLTNGVCDKDLSFAAVIAAQKDELEAEISEKLFPRN